MLKGNLRGGKSMKNSHATKEQRVNVIIQQKKKHK